MIKSNLSDTDKAIILFNTLLADGVIKDLILGFPDLDKKYTNCTKEVIANLLESYGDKFYPEVKLYRPWNPFSAAYATTYSGNYKLIKLNSRRLNRSLASIAGSIAHEWGHCFEYYMVSTGTAVYFNHGDNSPVGKDYTFQYLLGRRVKRYIDENGQDILRNFGIN